MNREKVKLIIKNIELLVESLKSELYSDEQKMKVNRNKIQYDYDEVFEDFE
jgi:hypothetical protein